MLISSHLMVGPQFPSPILHKRGTNETWKSTTEPTPSEKHFSISDYLGGIMSILENQKSNFLSLTDPLHLYLKIIFFQVSFYRTADILVNINILKSDWQPRSDLLYMKKARYKEAVQMISFLFLKRGSLGVIYNTWTVVFISGQWLCFFFFSFLFFLYFKNFPGISRIFNKAILITVFHIHTNYINDHYNKGR